MLSEADLGVASARSDVDPRDSRVATTPGAPVRARSRRRPPPHRDSPHDDRKPAIGRNQGANLPIRVDRGADRGTGQARLLAELTFRRSSMASARARTRTRFEPLASARAWRSHYSGRPWPRRGRTSASRPYRASARRRSPGTWSQGRARESPSPRLSGPPDLTSRRSVRLRFDVGRSGPKLCQVPARPASSTPGWVQSQTPLGERGLQTGPLRRVEGRDVVAVVDRLQRALQRRRVERLAGHVDRQSVRRIGRLADVRRLRSGRRRWCGRRRSSRRRPHRRACWRRPSPSPFGRCRRRR